MLGDTYTITYTEVVQTRKFFMRFKETKSNKSETYITAIKAKRRYDKLMSDENTRHNIGILKNGNRLTYCELMAEASAEEILIKETELNMAKEKAKTSENKISSNSCFDMNKFDYVHIVNKDNDTVFVIAIDKISKCGELINIDVVKMMYLLDTCIDFNIAFKLLDETIDRFKFFDIDTIQLMIQGCFRMCYEQDIVTVVI